MQGYAKRGKYSAAPRGYSRARAQRRGRARARGRRPARGVPGYTRTAGYYGRFTSLAKPELKFFDQDVDDASVAVGATIFTNGSAEASLLRIPEGNGESDRIGRKVVIRKIGWRFKMLLVPATASASTSDVVRVIMYQDKQTNGAAAANTDILETADFQSFNNLANSQRFRILMDKTYTLRALSGSGRGTTDTLAFGEDQVTDTFWKTCNIPIEYNNAATTGALATIRSNNLGVLICSEQGLCVFGSKMRIRYSDH